MTANQLITELYLPLQPSGSVALALSHMEEYRLSHLPVVEGTEYLGLISDSDLSAMSDQEVSIERCGFTMIRPYVSENQPVFDVVRQFHDLKLTALPVLNTTNHYLGLIVLQGLTDFFASLTAVGNPGGVIVLELNDKDYDLTEIAQIVESNDNKILSLYITSFPDSTRIELTIKLNRIDIGPVLQTFFRFNYLVKASWSSEDSYNEGLQERYDGLMNYLNI